MIPLPCVASSRGCSLPQLGRRWSGGGVCPQDFLIWGQTRQQFGRGSGWFCFVLLHFITTQKFRVHRSPSPLSSWLSPPPLPLARDLQNPAPPKPLSGPAAPRAFPWPPPLPAPTQPL